MCRSFAAVGRYALALGHGILYFSELALALGRVHSYKTSRFRAHPLDFGHSSLVSLVTRAKILSVSTKSRGFVIIVYVLATHVKIMGGPRRELPYVCIALQTYIFP